MKVDIELRGTTEYASDQDGLLHVNQRYRLIWQRDVTQTSSNDSICEDINEPVSLVILVIGLLPVLFLYLHHYYRV